MKSISRRSFLKGFVTGTALCSIAHVFRLLLHRDEEISMYVDQEGNAFLKGVELNVDLQGNAEIK